MSPVNVQVLFMSSSRLANSKFLAKPQLTYPFYYVLQINIMVYLWHKVFHHSKEGQTSIKIVEVHIKVPWTPTTHKKQQFVPSLRIPCSLQNAKPWHKQRMHDLKLKIAFLGHLLLAFPYFSFMLVTWFSMNY